jgi:hypothetical protein
VLTLHGRGIWSNRTVKPAEHEAVLGAQDSERCSICSFPRIPEDRKVTKGNVEVFVGQYAGVRSGNSLVITPLMENSWRRKPLKERTYGLFRPIIAGEIGRIIAIKSQER